ncbi:hypothetical protein HZB01_03200 [Candidatus Woesearchaeota archaeon]|nr:hypothetical protein [Candidatus Woesearchaeota archaeon]
MSETVTIKQVYSKLNQIEEKMITREQLSEYLETFAVMTNPETVEGIKKSRDDIRFGRIRAVTSVKDILR